jgi:hypothetical protein
VADTLAFTDAFGASQVARQPASHLCNAATDGVPGRGRPAAHDLLAHAPDRVDAAPHDEAPRSLRRRHLPALEADRLLRRPRSSPRPRRPISTEYACYRADQARWR